MINSQSTNHHTSQRLSCFVSRYDAFSLSNVKNISRRKTYLWDKRNVPCKNKALFLFPRKNTIRNIYEIFQTQRRASTIWFSAYFQTCFRREKKCGQSKNYYGSFSFQRLWNGCTKLRKLFVRYFFPSLFLFESYYFFLEKKKPNYSCLFWYLA